MPVNNFTVGKDISLVIQLPTGPLTLTLTDFGAKPKTTSLESKPLNGIKQHAYIPDGWDISFKLDRMDTSADDFWANFEAQYYAGVNQVAGTIYETISEADGSVSQWRFANVVVKLDNAGDYSGDKKVEQSFSGMASQRIRVS
jgi:hypothetical protein